MNPLSIFSPHFKNTNFCEFYKLIDITENSQQTSMPGKQHSEFKISGDAGCQAASCAQYLGRSAVHLCASQE